MKRRNVLAAALALCLAFALTGCSKDSIINGFNDFLYHASQYALTDGKKTSRESGRQARTPTLALTRRNTTASAAPNTSSAGRGSSGKAGMS